MGCILILGAAVLYPAGRMFVSALHQWDASALLGPAGVRAILNTIALGLATVLVSGVFGTALAFLLTRYRFPGRGVLAAVAYLPFALPPLVGVLSFWYLIGLDGFLPRTASHYLGLDISLRGWGAVLLIHGYSFYVFFYAMVSAALATMDHSLAEAARTLGATRWQAFTRVTLPLLRPSLAGASLLAFMSSGASFSAPYYFGQDFAVLSTAIFREQQQFRTGAALSMTVILAAISLMGLFLFRSARRPGGHASKGTIKPLRSAAGRVAAAAVAWTTVGLLLIPHFTIIWLSFVDHRAWQAELAPTVYTLGNYAELVQNPAKWRPVINSLWMSAVATAAALAVGIPAGYLLGRKRLGQGAVGLLVMVPWALPGTVVGICLLVAFNDPWLPAGAAIMMLPLAYFVRSVPLMTRVASAGIESFDASLIEAARTLGASRWHSLRRVALPLLWPGLVAGAALVFTQSLGEFVASILLYLPSNKPISIEIADVWNGSGIGAAFAYSVFLMLLVIAAFAASRRFGGRASL